MKLKQKNIIYMKVHYYYPYKSDKPEKKYHIITKSEKKVYFGHRLPRLILQYIKMKKENKDI